MTRSFLINHDGARPHKHSRKRPVKHSRKHSRKHSKKHSRRVNNSGILKPLKGIRSCAGFSSVASCESNPNCMFTENNVCTPKHKRRRGHRVPTIQYGPSLPKESDMLLADGRKRSKKSGKRSKRSGKMSKRSGKMSKMSKRSKRSKRSKSVDGKRRSKKMSTKKLLKMLRKM